jgi:hypothetical protein
MVHLYSTNEVDNFVQSGQEALFSSHRLFRNSIYKWPPFSIDPLHTLRKQLTGFTEC